MADSDFDLKFLDYPAEVYGGKAVSLGAEEDTDLLDAYSRTVVKVVDKVGPAVVHIRIKKPTRSGTEEVAGSGSGVITQNEGSTQTP